MAMIETWGSEEVKVANFHFTWTINNFSFCLQEAGTELVSPEYLTGGYDAAGWTLQINLKGDTTDTKEFVGLYLCLGDSNKPLVNAKFQFSILNEKREKMNVHPCSGVCQFTKIIGSTSWGWPKFIKMNSLNDERYKLLLNDQLTIVCELRLIEEVISTSGGDETFKIKVPDCDLIKNMKVLLNKEGKSDAFTDATLIVGERRYKTHRAVLASRSSFFNEMFVDKTMDGATSIFEIPDIEDTIFNEILNFIYTDRVNDFEIIAEELLSAAARFGLPGLKVICEKSLAEFLSVENAVETLLLAHDSGANVLRSQTIDFIIKNATKVIGTRPYASLFETHPQIIAEIAFEKLLLMTKSGASDGTLLHGIKEKCSK